MTTETISEATNEKDAVVTTDEVKTDDRRARSAGRRNNTRGRKKREPKEFEESILDISRVTRVVKGGRRMRFRVCVVIGDKKGRVGMGTGKSNEVVTSIQKAVAQAKKSLVTVPIFDETLPHAVESKYKASKVLLFRAPKGKGVIAGGSVRKILELAGYKDVLSKVHGSRNKLNVAHATMQAFAELQKKGPVKKVVAVDDESVEGDVAGKSAKAVAPKKSSRKKKVVTEEKK